MSDGIYRVPMPQNEPVLTYAPQSKERATLKAALKARASEVVEIPCVIGGQPVFTGRVEEITMPSDHQRVIARVHLAGPDEVAGAIDAALAAKADWAALPFAQRAGILLRAAELLTTTHRDRVNAATMLGQAKTCHQSEIDAVCELADFWRFNAWFGEKILSEQPLYSPDGTWNRMDHRPLDGFVFAVSPFNFSSIALNLCTAPALMGNVVVWKPALTSTPSCWALWQVLVEAGMPPGVINLVHGHGAEVGDPVLAHPELGGIHFTGSTRTFQGMWARVGAQLSNYRQYPRIVGETGGKDFIVAHPSADPQALAVAILRGAFEFQGQKCSAASRVYVPKALWPEVRRRLVEEMEQVKQGDVQDFSNFLSAVIDERAFKKHSEYLAYGREHHEVVAGGGADASKGWFIEPTVFEVSDPADKLLSEEIFGPIVAVHPYESTWEEVLRTVDQTSPYGLTGAIFARDRYAIEQATEALRFAAGNFYVNDKPTGAVVGQQPFGGGRASGTNDKAGSPLNLLRWTSPRSIKETFVSATDWRYPFLG